MNLSTNIRFFRQEAGMTQRQIADALGISAQSVSKWECGDGMPDISLLPSIARLFRISVDKLLSMGEDRQELASIELDEKRRQIEMEGRDDYEEIVALLRAHLKEYPLDWKQSINLAWLIFSYTHVPPHGDNRPKAILETAEILTRVFEYCDQAEIKYQALSMLLTALTEIEGVENGNFEQSTRIMELLSKIPGVENSREVTKASLVRAESGHTAILDAVDALYEELCSMIIFIVKPDGDKASLQRQYDTVITLTHLLYGHDLCSRGINAKLLNWHLTLASVLIDTDTPLALENLRQAAKYACRNDELPPDTSPIAQQPTALLPHIDRRARVSNNGDFDSWREFLCEYLQGYTLAPDWVKKEERSRHDMFAALEGNEEFEEIIRSLA